MMIKDDAVTVAFHMLTVKNKRDTRVCVDSTIKDIISTGLKALQVTTPEDKKRCFKTHNLYVNNIEANTDNIYCSISDSRYGYPEDIYITGTAKPITTGVNDIRSKKFFVNLDFSNQDYILVCNQYLGNSGCYMAIEKALHKILTDAGYSSHSVAMVNKGELSTYFQKGGIRSFEVTHFDPQPDVSDDTAFSRKCTVVLSPTTRSRNSLEKFHAKVSSIFLGDNDNIRDKQKIAKQIIQESDDNVAIVKNDGIDGINLDQYRVKVVSKHGTFDLINQDGTMATRYDVTGCVKDPDGNPNFDDLKNKINEIKKKINGTIE